MHIVASGSPCRIQTRVETKDIKKVSEERRNPSRKFTVTAVTANFVRIFQPVFRAKWLKLSEGETDLME